VTPRATHAAAAGVLVAAWLAAGQATQGVVEGPPRWLSAHTLATLRGYAAWGVGPTRGANVILPRAAEGAPAGDHDPRAISVGPTLRGLSKHEGAYLSYPSGWSVALYGLWRTVGSPPPEGFLAAVGQLLVGLGGALALFALVLAWLSLVASPGLSATGSTLAALAAGLAWLTAPPILYYGRHEVFTDPLVLPACLVATAVAIRARFELGAAGRVGRLVLAAAGLACWGTEWLGWLTMAVLAAGFAWRGRARSAGWAAVRAAWPLWLPAGLAVGLYLGQLSWYTAGWHDMAATFAQRGPGRTLDNGVPLTAGLVAGVMATHLAAAAPGGLREGLHPWAAMLLGDGLAGPGAVAAALGALVLALLGWRTRAWATDRSAWGWALAAVVLPAALHTGLLLQHACVHRFAALRWVAPLAVLLVALPLAAVLADAGRLGRRAVAALVVALGVGWLAASRPALATFAPPGNPLPAALARLLTTHLGPEDVALSHELAFDTMHPEPVWLANRLVHTPAQLGALLPHLDPGTVARMTPVLLAWADGPSRHAWGALPAGARWEALPTTVLGRRVVRARLAAQRGRLPTWLASLRLAGSATGAAGLQ
jgi:hypothetical protein